MAGLNKITLIGNLGRDPEMRYMPDGRAVANFSIATSEEWKDKATGEKRERTTWFRIIAFGKLGEICGEYLSKGKQVYIEGRLQTNEWTDQEGRNRFSLEVIASQMLMLGRKGDSYNSSGASSGYERTPPSSGYDSPAPVAARPKASSPVTPDEPPSGEPGGVPEEDIPF